MTLRGEYILYNKDGLPVFTARMMAWRTDSKVTVLGEKYQFACPKCRKVSNHTSVGFKNSHCPCWPDGYILQEGAE